MDAPFPEGIYFLHCDNAKLQDPLGLNFFFGFRTTSLVGSGLGVAVISAKNHKRQRCKRQSVTAKREKSQTPNFITAIQTSPNLT